MKKEELCQDCFQGYLVFCQNGPFCPVCQKYKETVELVPETRIVPSGYRQYSSEKMSSRVKHATGHIREFGEKYSIRDSSMIDILLQQVTKFIGSNSRCYSYRVACAAIFFQHYRKELKLRVRTFCQENHIEIKKFGTALLRYMQIVSQTQSQEKMIKEKDEEDVRRLIEAVSDKIFDFSFVCENRVKEYQKCLFNETIQEYRKINDQSNILPISLFRGLKNLKHPISATKFMEICRQHNIYVSRKKLKAKPTETKTETKSETTTVNETAPTVDFQ